MESLLSYFLISSKYDLVNLEQTTQDSKSTVRQNIIWQKKKKKVTTGSNFDQVKKKK